MYCAEGGSAAQAIATASAHALAAGSSEGVAIARAFAVAIGIYSCPGVKPVLASACALITCRPLGTWQPCWGLKDVAA